VGTVSTDVDVLVNQIVYEEPLISESKKPHLRKLIYSEWACFADVFFRPVLFPNQQSLCDFGAELIE
jgi:hypothetical protein